MTQKEIIRQATQLIDRIGFDLEHEAEQGDPEVVKLFDHLLTRAGDKARACGYTDEDIGMITQDC